MKFDEAHNGLPGTDTVKVDASEEFDPNKYFVGYCANDGTIYWTNTETAASDAFRELVKDLTLHIAAASPAGIGRDEISDDLVEAEKDLFRKQMADSGKPPEILDKIIEGKLGKFYSTICLLEQGFIKDPDNTISDLLASKGKELDDEISIRRFTRYGVGE